MLMGIWEPAYLLLGNAVIANTLRYLRYLLTETITNDDVTSVSILCQYSVLTL